MWQASAPGKIILCGEHAVVYGRPAIAAPVNGVQATATVTPGTPGRGVVLALPDLGRQVALSRETAEQPLAHVAHLALKTLGLHATADLTITLRSTIPVAGGLGSGAAAATAIVRSLAAAAGQSLAPAAVSALVYESEKQFHGTPSGVDNTVVAYGMAVWFVRGQPPQPFTVAAPCTLVIGDTGVPSPTSLAVGDVRRGWQADVNGFWQRFDAIGAITRAARVMLAAGDVAALGPLMDENQRLLAELGVSSPALEMLCQAARRAGAWGAKLSGGGRGGNMIALTAPETADSIAAALQQAGAVRTLVTTIE